MKCFRIILILVLTLITGCSINQTTYKNPNSVPETKVPKGYTVSPSSENIDVGVKVDLDGDGSQDNISFVCQKAGSEFTLSVNGISVKGHGDNLDGNFKIVDIDSRDNIKEISIPESGPSGDFKTAFYYYDGKHLMDMGKVQGTDAVKINGSGTIVARARGLVLHTWFYDDPYILTKLHLLERVPKDLYEMNCKVKVKRPLNLKKSRSGSQIAITLQSGEEVTILSSDDKEWCLVENKEGVRGWFAVDRFVEIRGTNLNTSEFFEGLNQAD